jgi:ketose-bisphosphate aldolase
MLVPFNELLSDARAGKYSVGFFEAWDVYSLEAVLEAAEDERAPVVLGFGEVMMEPGWLDRGAVERLGALGRAAADSSRVPVSLLLNEASSMSHIVRGIHSGYNAVMLDSGDLPYDENVRLTRYIVEMAHAVGVGVEAEIGVLPNVTGEMGDAGARLTDPDEAARFVEQTGIDALSVSVGNVHLLSEGKAAIDLERLEAIHRKVAVPLVIHGGTGFPEDAIGRALECGVAKINIGTVLKRVFLEGLEEAVRTLGDAYSYHQVLGSRKETDVLQQGKIRMKEEVARRIKLWRPVT